MLYVDGPAVKEGRRVLTVKYAGRRKRKSIVYAADQSILRTMAPGKKEEIKGGDADRHFRLGQAAAARCIGERRLLYRPQ